MIASAGDFDEHVGALVFFGQGEDVVLAGGQHDFLALVGADHAEAAGVLGDERIGTEEELEVHRIVVHGDFAEIAVVERDSFVFRSWSAPAGKRRTRLRVGQHIRKTEAQRHGDGVQHEKRRVHQTRFRAADGGTVNASQTGERLMGHVLPHTFLHQRGNGSFGNLCCVFLDQSRITADCHPSPKRVEMHAAQSIPAMKPHLFTSFFLLSAPLGCDAATIALRGHIQGPNTQAAPGTSTLDFYWFTAETSGEVTVAGFIGSLPTNAVTTVGLNLKFYTRPDVAGVMPLLGTTNFVGGELQSVPLYLPAGQYLLAVLPGTSSFNGTLPLPALESHAGRLFGSIGYNGTISGNVRLEEVWLGQPDGTFQVTVIPEPHTVAVAGVLIAAALTPRRRFSQS